MNQKLEEQKEQRKGKPDESQTVHPDLKNMHRLTQVEGVKDEFYTSRALKEGEFTTTIKGVFVDTQKSVWAEVPEDTDTRTQVTSIQSTLSEYDDKILGIYDTYHKGTTAYLSYEDCVYFLLDIPNKGEKLCLVDSFNEIFGKKDYNLIEKMISDYNHLSNLTGVSVILTDIQSNGCTITYKDKSTSSKYVDEIADGKRDTVTLSDVTGYYRYKMNYKDTGKKWIEADCELLMSEDTDKAALAVDLFGVTRVFEFTDTDFEKSNTKFNTIVSELGNGSIECVSGTVQIGLAHQTDVTRNVLKKINHDNEVMKLDTTGCWSLRHPSYYSESDSSNTEKNRFESVFASLSESLF